MRTFANLFLFFFVTDGLLSTLDDLLGLTFNIEVLSPLRNLNALATLALAVPLLFALGFDRRLPKRVFLPLCAFLLWSSAGCWPLLGLLATQHLLLLASLLQLLLGGLTLAYLRRRSGTSVQLTVEDFHGPAFSLRHTLGYFAALLLALPLLIGYVTLGTLSLQLDTQTAGFMRVSPLGLYMKERTYRHQDKQVRLTGMMHIGEQRYFSSLAQSLGKSRAIVLAEGVSDRQGLLTSGFDYEALGSVLGLTTQKEMAFDARKVDLTQLDELEWDEAELKPDIAMVDVDLSSFTPLTVEFLNVLGRLISSSGSFTENYALYNAWIEEHMSADFYDTLMGDILDKRNENLIGHLNRALQRYDSVVIPWGAMHMPALETALLAQGFHQVAEREHLSLDFRNLPYRELLSRLETLNLPPSPATVAE